MSNQTANRSRVRPGGPTGRSSRGRHSARERDVLRGPGHRASGTGIRLARRRARVAAYTAEIGAVTAAAAKTRGCPQRRARHREDRAGVACKRQLRPCVIAPVWLGCRPNASRAKKINTIRSAASKDCEAEIARRAASM
ncbi:hypothetical protein MRX96_013977 [Rhipicephalus microplus]